MDQYKGKTYLVAFSAERHGCSSLHIQEEREIERIYREKKTTKTGHNCAAVVELEVRRHLVFSLHYSNLFISSDSTTASFVGNPALVHLAKLRRKSTFLFISS